MFIIIANNDTLFLLFTVRFHELSFTPVGHVPIIITVKYLHFVTNNLKVFNFTIDPLRTK